MIKIINKIVCCLLFIAMFSLLSCSDQSSTKQEIIAVYNEYAKHSPPTLGEGVYPLTANFKTDDKGNEGKAQSLVDIGFLRPIYVSSASSSYPAPFADNIITFHLTALGKKFYDPEVKGFVWGNHSAISVSNIKFVTTSGQKTAYVTLKTKIINIPDWARKPIILANYPIVRESLDKNEFNFNAVYKFINNRWVLVESIEAERGK